MASRNAVGTGCIEWLTRWEPMRLPHQPDPETSRELFAARCAARERERHAGTQYSFGIFVDGTFAGEINLNNVIRGAMQSATIGYWIDKARAGQSFMSGLKRVTTGSALPS